MEAASGSADERGTSDILPWLRLQEAGVRVRMLEPRSEVLSAEEVEAAFTPHTRAVCLTWVHSFSGRMLDLDAVGAVCRDHGVWFVVNGSQAVAGSRSMFALSRSMRS